MHAPQYWLIGDIQGCAKSLQLLLNQPELQHPAAHYIFVGDLVNRGPDSLGVLQLIRSLGARAQVVLGNHDIHLLGVVAGIRSQSPTDTLGPILQSAELPSLVNWLRYQPLALHVAGHLVVHAGVHPSWNLKHCLALAQQVSQLLQAPDWQLRLAGLFGNKPNYWSTQLNSTDQLRVVVNILTRLRYFDKLSGTINKSYQGPPQHAPAGLVPWFDMPQRQLETPVVFGHWSTLGLHLRADSVGIDTGCLWGGQLTALCLDNRQVVQVNNVDGALHPF